MLMWTFGMLGYHGMNSAGVAHFESASGGGPDNRFGIPHYPVERMMLECDRLDRATDLLRTMSLASNANSVLCDGQGSIADVEGTTAGAEAPPIGAPDRRATGTGEGERQLQAYCQHDGDGEPAAAVARRNRPHRQRDAFPRPVRWPVVA